MNKTQFTAILLAFLACLIWSGNFVIAQGVSDWISPMVIAFWRWFIALIFILPISCKHVRKDWPIIVRNWKYLAVMGIVGVGFYNTLIYYSGQYTSTHHMAIISSTAPIGTLLLAGIFGIERLSRYKIIGAACAFIGALVIVTNGDLIAIFSQKWNAGDIILIFSALIWAAWSVAITIKPKALSTWSFLATIITIGVLFLAPLYAWETYRGASTPFTVEAFSIFIYVGVMASVIAWFLWQHCVDTVGPVKTSLIYYSMPVFAGVLAIALLNEPIEQYHVVGFMLVCLGIIISNLRKMGFVKKTKLIKKDGPEAA